MTISSGSQDSQWRRRCHEGVGRQEQAVEQQGVGGYRGVAEAGALYGEQE
ncbi:hypothetical protein H7972_09955, partial [Pseudomonas aeruginosa]|nr:hypothetical protein [Pseudomonas aeruginosa]